MKKIFGTISKETDKAYLFSIALNGRKNSINISSWLPKSKINIIRFKHYSEVDLPFWLYKIKFEKKLKEVELKNNSQLELNPKLYPNLA